MRSISRLHFCCRPYTALSLSYLSPSSSPILFGQHQHHFQFRSKSQFSQIMTKEATPPPRETTTTSTTHEPPSLPASPLAKRPKPSDTTGTSASAIKMVSTDSTAPVATAPTASTPTPALLVKKLTDTARAPTRGSAFAAGYDLYAAKETIIPAKGKGLVDTGLAVAVPEGTYGRVAPRSGLASKHFIDVGAGVIDADYRGEVKVLLFNFSDVDFTIKEGDRVAQLVLERIYTPEVAVVEELAESVRGAGGFGSTGTN